MSAVTRTVDGRHLPVEDEALIDMQFARGKGRIELSWAAESRTNDGSIRGSRGEIRTLGIETRSDGLRQILFSLCAAGG